MIMVFNVFYKVHYQLKEFTHNVIQIKLIQKTLLLNGTLPFNLVNTGIIHYIHTELTCQRPLLLVLEDFGFWDILFDFMSLLKAPAHQGTFYQHILYFFRLTPPVLAILPDTYVTFLTFSIHIFLKPCNSLILLPILSGYLLRLYDTYFSTFALAIIVILYVRQALLSFINYC